MSFRTAYVDEQGTIVTDQQQVALRYIKGWFLLDLLSTVPFDLMFGSSGLESMRLLRILRLIRLVRLLKVRNVTPKDRAPATPERPTHCSRKPHLRWHV